MATRPNAWPQPETTTLTLPSGGEIDARQPDIMSLVMSDNYTQIPNGLLEQVSRRFSGQSADRELVCHSGLRLPDAGEPVQQGQGRDMVRGRVVSARGEADFFKVTVSLLMGSQFNIDPLTPNGTMIRFGGANQAVIIEDNEAKWQPKPEDFPRLGAFTRLIVCAAAVSPKLVETVTDPETELAYSRLSSADRDFIFAWAMPSEVRPAETFPQEPPTNLPAAPHVRAVPLESSGRNGTGEQLGEVAI
jgi:hypothetical protein